MKRLTIVSLKKVSILVFLFIGVVAKAQVLDIESLIEAKPIKFSGSLGAELLYSDSDNFGGTEQQPFQYFLSGNLTATLYGKVAVPLSFSYSNRKFNTTYPKNQQNFNRFGLSPKYKWVTAHAGWRSMSFSKYSLNGHSFLGGGVELSPGEYDIKVMHGRLLQAVTPDSSVVGNSPSFERWGSGIQLARKYKGSLYGVSFFRAKDKNSTIPGGLDNVGVTPEENFVAALELSQKIGKILSFSIDYASSNLTSDSRAVLEESSFVNNNVFIKSNLTTKRYNAFKTAFKFDLQKANIGFGYERVDPGYSSHGSYFYNNDFENVTMSFAAPLLQNKFNFSTSLGLERDNISKVKTSTANRLIGQLNLTWAVSEKLQFATNYSNFKNVAEFNPYANQNVTANPYDNIDSLRYVQVSQNGSFNMTYNMKTETIGQGFTVFANVMQTTNEIGGKLQDSDASFYNTNLSYNFKLIPQNISLTASGNLNWNEILSNEGGMLGPTVGVSTKMFKTIGTNLMYTWNTPVGNNLNSGDMHRVGLNLSMTIKKKHNLNFSTAWLTREIRNNLGNFAKIEDFMGRLGYSYSF